MQKIKPGYPQMGRPKTVHESRMSNKDASACQLVLLDIRKKLDAKKNNGDKQCTASKKSENGSNATPNFASKPTRTPSGKSTKNADTSVTSNG